MKGNIQPAKVRNSNIELLRLVCTLSIVLHHFIGHGLQVTVIGSGRTTDAGLIVASFLVIGVNCYILISGYFGIKAQWKGFFRLYLACVFFDLLFKVLHSIDTHTLDFKEMILSLFPFSNTGLWFIPQYFYLYLLSPVLNKVIDNCSKRQHIQMLFIWGILAYYFGFLWLGTISHFIYFIFLYFLGRFIALYTENVTTPKRRMVYVCIYLLSVVVRAVCAVTMFHMGQDWILNIGFSYKNPLMLVSSVSVFLFFRSLNFQNKIINWFAASSFAVYLIHENKFVVPYLYGYVYNLPQQIDNNYLLGLSLILLAIITVVGCVLADKVRRMITNPIEKILDRVDWKEHSNKWIDRLEKVIK